MYLIKDKGPKIGVAIGEKLDSSSVESGCFSAGNDMIV